MSESPVFFSASPPFSDMGKQSPSIEICVSVIVVVVLLMREGMPMIILLGMLHCQKKQRFLAEYIRFLSILSFCLPFMQHWAVFRV